MAWVFVLLKPVVQVFCLAAIKLTCRLTSQNVYPEFHKIKKPGEIPWLSIWLPGGHDLRTPISINSIIYRQIVPEKFPLDERGWIGKTDVVDKPQHIIHKAISWQKMLEDAGVESLSEIAKKEGLTRARVTQIMNNH